MSWPAHPGPHWSGPAGRDILGGMDSPASPPRRARSVLGALARARTAYTDIFVDDWGPRRGLRARVVSLIFLSFLSGPILSVIHSDWSLTRQIAALTAL